MLHYKIELTQSGHKHFFKLGLITSKENHFKNTKIPCSFL